MNLGQIKLILEREEALTAKDVIDRLSELKTISVAEEVQDTSKEIWCIEKVVLIKNLYIKAFNNLREKKHFDAWNDLERIEIEFVFLRRHFDYSGNKYNLEFIEEYSRKLQKFFPYFVFTSRESIVKKAECSICGKQISIRKPCGHKIGNIYNGEMCVSKVVDMEFLGMAIVQNPMDKYTVLFPKEKEYNYSMLDNLMEYLKTPFNKWELEIVKELKPEYKNVGRNDICPCGSEKKYKKCCNETGKDLMDHHKILFYNRPEGEIMPYSMIGTWKN